MGIEFSYPILLLLVIPALIAIFLFLKKKKQMSFFEAYWIAGIRLIIFLLVIFALSLPQIFLPAKGEMVIFLIDRSASVGNSDDYSLNWIETSVMHKRNDDAFAVVTFGENVSLEQNSGTHSQALQQFGSLVKDHETNIETGIQFASSLIPQNGNGRIVLLSDGNETAGNSGEAANLLKNRNIELDYVLLKNQTGEDLSISEMNVPPSLYQGEEAQISFTITSNSSKKAVIRLSVNNNEILKKMVDVKEGKNVYTFSHKAETSGLSVYKGEISAENDTFIENNVLYSVTNVKGIPKILLVQGESGGNLDQIIKDSGLEVETIPPEKLPTALSSYLEYQSIIFNNVPATSMTENQMNMIEKAVKEFGTGFVMAGGEDSFGLGGYFKTPIEKLLPVDMEIKGKQEMPSLGLMIVLDRSGSMTGSKLELAKEAAARSVELLREEDTLGFIAFDDRPWVIVETEPLKDKKKAADQIRSVTPGGGTEIYSSLELAYEELADLKLQRKHIILLTDGQTPGGDYEGLIEAGKDKNITLSTVALGSDADQLLLEDLASMGSGRFYDVTDSSVIPSILSRETVMATRTYIEDNPFYPVIQPYPDWQKVFENGVPKMNAYIATTPKNRAQVPMISEKEDPILAEWQYGIGHTIAFTSDFSGKWSGDWARWENWAVFINGLITKTLPQYESEPYRTHFSKEDGKPILTLESVRNQTLPIEASLVSESGEILSTNAKLAAPGKYEIPLPNSPGMFYLSVKQRNQDGTVQTYQTGFSVPYSDEYVMNGPNGNVLKELAKKTGGKELVTEKDSFRPVKKKNTNKQPISQFLILSAFLLFFMEIAIRRFGLIHLVSRSMTKRRPKKDESLIVNQEQPVNENRMKQKSAAIKDEIVNTYSENKKKGSKNQPKTKTERLSSEERSEKMKRLLEAKNRKK